MSQVSPLVSKIRQPERIRDMQACKRPDRVDTLISGSLEVRWSESGEGILVSTPTFSGLRRANLA